MDSVEPRVTICIPHTIRYEILDACVQALRDNVSIAFKVIIIHSGEKPISYVDDNIQIVHDMSLGGIGAKRALFAEMVDTEFMMFLDDDMLVEPDCVELQMEALDNHPELGLVSSFDHPCANFQPPRIKKFRVWKFEADPMSRLSYFDYVPFACVTLRMDAVRDIEFDARFLTGYTHHDTMLQLFYFTDWQCAMHWDSKAVDIGGRSPPGYRRLRRGYRRGFTRRLFVEKWDGYLKRGLLVK